MVEIENMVLALLFGGWMGRNVPQALSGAFLYIGRVSYQDFYHDFGQFEDLKLRPDNLKSVKPCVSIDNVVIPNVINSQGKSLDFRFVTVHGESLISKCVIVDHVDRASWTGTLMWQNFDNDYIPPQSVNILQVTCIHGGAQTSSVYK